MAAAIEIPWLGKKRFEDVDEFRSWLNNEKEHYGWARVRFRSNEIQNVRDHWLRQPGSEWLREIDHILEATKEFRGHEWSEEAKANIETELKSRNQKSPALWSETTAGQYIDNVKESTNDTCAIGALIYLSGADINPPQVSSKDFWDGWLFAFLYSHGLQKSVPKKYKTIDALVEEFRNELGELNNTVQRRIDESKQELQRLEEKRSRFATRAQAQAKGLRRLRDAFRNVAKSEVEKQRKMVSDYIAMHSSVDYWETKTVDFADEARTWGRWYYWSIGLGTLLIVILVAVAVAVLVMAPLERLQNISERFELIGNFYIFVTGGVAISIGMWLWATRMFGRLYLQARAQKEDAEHRVTAIKSYLAMLTDAGAFEKDAARELILPAIFGPPQVRPTDAGGPPVSVDRVMKGIGLR